MSGRLDWVPPPQYGRQSTFSGNYMVQELVFDIESIVELTVSWQPLELIVEVDLSVSAYLDGDKWKKAALDRFIREESTNFSSPS